MNKIFIFIFIFIFSGCAAIKNYQKRFVYYVNNSLEAAVLERDIEMSALGINIEEKALLFEKDVSDIFLTSENIVASSYNTRDRTPGSLGDSAIWSGVYLGAQSLRFAVTKDETAKKNALRTLEGLFLLQDITQCRGCLARAARPYNNELLKGKIWQQGNNDFSHLQWLSPPSVDSYVGLMFGYALAYDLLNDQNASIKIQSKVRDIAYMIIENDFHLVGNYDFPVVSGNLNSFIEKRLGHIYLLSFLKIASYITQDSYIQAVYQKVGEQWAADAAKGLPSFFKFQDHNANNLYFLAAFNLIRLARDTNDPFLNEYLIGLEYSWKKVKLQRNAFHSYVAYAVDYNISADALKNARQTLQEFPYPKFGYPTHNSARKDIKVCLLNYRFWKPRGFFHENRRQTCKNPIPIYQRPQSDYEWKENPYRLDNFSSDPAEIYSGVDFLIAYWLARYKDVLN